MTFERTDGDGMVMAGCQQMTVNNITFGRVGDPANDTGELRLTNSPNFERAPDEPLQRPAPWAPSLTRTPIRGRTS